MPYIYRYALIVSIGGFLFGFDSALISGLVPSITQAFNLNQLQLGFVISAPALGAALALCFVGKIATSRGRKGALVLVSRLYCLALMMALLSPNYTLLVLARLLCGVAFCSLSLSSMYLGEVSPSAIRGKLVSINQLSLVVGLCLAYIVNFALINTLSHYLLAQHLWRGMLALELIPALSWFILLRKIPESPRWLLSQGLENQAKLSLRQVLPNTEFLNTWSSLKSNKETSPTSAIKALGNLFSWKMRRLFIIGFFLAFMQAATGMNAILVYAPSVFSQLGFTENAALLQSAYIGITTLIFTLFSLYLVDRVGRRPLLLWGLAFAVLSHLTSWYAISTAPQRLSHEFLESLEQLFDLSLPLVVDSVYSSKSALEIALAEYLSGPQLALISQQQWHLAQELNAKLVLAGLLGFIAAYSLSLGPIMWIVFSEVFPSSIRSIATPFFALLASLGSYLSQLLLPWQLAELGAANTFFIYAANGFVALIFIAIVLPETKNQGLEDISRLLVANGDA